MPGALAPSAADDDLGRHRRAAAMPADERRSMIIAATLPLLVEQGEMATTHDIAEAAGIAEGTIFRVFESKDALIKAVIDYALDAGPLEHVMAEIDTDRPLEDIVCEVVALFQERLVSVWRLMSSVGPRFHEHARRPAVHSKAVERIFRHHRPSLSVSPAEAARTLRAFTLAATHPMLSPEPLEAREVARRFLYGVVEKAPC